MLILNLFEELEGPPEPTLIDALRDFLPIAVKHLKIKELPKIKLVDEVETDHMPSFGKFSNDDRTVHLGIKNRHPNDVLRTLAHEMVHYAQGQRDELDADSWHTGSPEEDQANAEAGVIMREFNEQFPQYMELKPIMLEKWSKKYKKSINCNNPKGFSQKAHCAGKKKHTNEAEGQHCDAKNAVPELKSALEKRKTELKNADAKVAYDKIDKIMTRIAQTYNISGQKLHDLWTERYGEIPDTWVLGENFADGKGPGKPGDSQRHGIPKGATMAELEKASHAKGRKGQLARWQINMRRGHKK
jgi:Zn-dependent peptidase ImmA (M78 family)